MKFSKLSLLGWLFILPFTGFSQVEHTTHWYFGFGAGLDFSSGSPVSVANSTMIAREGSTAYSDQNGDLLFYSNGVGVLSDTAAVWNRNHQIMPNGILTGLTGYASTIQSSIVVPVPGSIDTYYLFTLDGTESYGAANFKGLTYSIIDMSLDNGLGDVTVKAAPITTPAAPFLGEKMTATKHANGTDYWLIVHEGNYINQVSDEFFMIQISSSGLSTPISQHIGNEISVSMQSTMEVSSQGDKVAYNWEVFDFDNATGILSNPRNIGSIWGYKEFSRDGRFLYVAKYGHGLYQYDLDASDLPGSQVTLSSYTNFGQLQLGPDDKIYVGKGNNGTSLAVINNPGTVGLGCNFVYSQVNLAAGTTTDLGMPNFIDNMRIIDETGIASKDTENDVSFYPNPASDAIYFKSDNQPDLEVTIFDVNGKMVISPIKIQTGKKMNVSSLNPGQYLIQIEGKNSTLWKKLSLF